MKRLAFSLGLWAAVLLFLATVARGQELPASLQTNSIDEQYPGLVAKIYGWAGEPKHFRPTRENRAGEYEVHEDTQTVWRGQPFVPPLNVQSQDDLTITCRDDICRAPAKGIK